MPQTQQLLSSVSFDPAPFCCTDIASLSGQFGYMEDKNHNCSTQLTVTSPCNHLNVFKSALSNHAEQHSGLGRYLFIRLCKQHKIFISSSGMQGGKLFAHTYLYNRKVSVS